MVTSIAPAADETHKNPNQSQIDQINDSKALIEAQDNLLKAQTALIRDTYPALGDLGKKGALTVETADRDKFHVTARSAQAFALIADQLVAVLGADPVKAGPIVLLQDSDRAATQVYVLEAMALESLEAKVASLLAEPPKATPMALGGGLLELSAILTQVGQFTQLFRTDKSVSFTDSLLSDDVLMDLVAWKIGSGRTVHYPAGELDRFFAKDFTSDYSTRLRALLRKRDAVAKLGDKGKAVFDEMTTLATRLSTPDAATKLPPLLVVLRGELVQNYLSTDGVSLLTVKVVTKGGASLKTSNFFRSDRLYAAGGAVISYRVATSGKNSKTVSSGVLTAESGFVEVPLAR